MENQYLRVRMNENGSIDVWDKVNKSEYRGLSITADGADAGDEYNYSFPENDIIITNENIKAEIEVVEKSFLKAVVKISQILKLPESLTDDRKNRSKKLRDFPIISWISLEAKSPIINFRTVVKNTVKDHRLRVLFPTGIDTKYSFAGTQFDFTKHEITPKTFDDSDIPEDVKRIIIGARESEPITTFPQYYFVDINDRKRGITVLNKGLPEYEILPDNSTIALTLFRAVGWLARGDLLTRIGDAGPIIFTPDAQCLRQMTFEYALYFHQGDCCQGRVYQLAEEFNVNLKIIKTGQYKGRLKDTNGFLSLKSKNDTLQVTAIKRAQDDEEVILRLFNPSAREVEGEVFVNYNLDKIYYVNLKEEVIEEIRDREKNKFRLKVKPKDIVTLKLEIARKDILIKTGESIDAKRTEIQLLNDESFSKINLNMFIPPPLLTKDDITNEEKRLKEIERKLSQVQEEATKLENKVKKYEGSNPVYLAKLEFEFHKNIGYIRTYHRAALEARLSVVLSRKKYLETYNKNITDYNQSMEEIEKILREIGYDLNEARVNKRVYEYIVEYYQHRLKLISKTNSNNKRIN